MTKKKPQREDDVDRAPPPPKVGTSMKGLLRNVKLDASTKAAPKPQVRTMKPAKAPAKKPPAPVAPPIAAKVTRPSDSLRGHDRTAFYDAMAGVRGLAAGANAPPQRATELRLPPAPAAPETREDDRAVRARLAALVSDGLYFEIRREDEWLAGVRRDAPRGTLERLVDATPPSDAALDLHGARAAEVELRLTKFLRQKYLRGVHRVRIVHGKGLHSDAGGPVLGDAVITALTRGTAASIVLAFVTAPVEQGGSGALLVELAR